MTLSLEAKVDLLWDKLALSELMNSFGRALDLHDWDLYRSCLADRVTIDFSRLMGTPARTVDADLWTRFAAVALTPLEVHHQYSNFSAKISSDTASATIYMVARHHAPHDSRWNTQYGWYENRFIRSSEYPGWRISSLKHDFQWLAGTSDLIRMESDEAIALIAELFG